MSFSKNKVKIPCSINLSEDIDAESFYMRKIHQTGSASTITDVCFDSAQSLLAVGYMDGSVKIFGKCNLEVTLRAALCIKVSSLIWICNEGRLVVSDGEKSLFIWNVKSSELSLDNYVSIEKMADSRLVTLVKVDSFVVCLAASLGNSVLFAGCNQGNVYVLNARMGKLAPSSIKCLAEKKIPVCQIISHPQQETKLLIGYRGDGIYLYDLNEGRLLKKFCIENGLSKFCLDPCYSFLAVGTLVGGVQIWSLGNEKKALNVKIMHSLSNDSISQIKWTEFDGKNYIIVKQSEEFILLRYDKTDYSNPPNSQQNIFVDQHDRIYTIMNINGGIDAFLIEFENKWEMKKFNPLEFSNLETPLSLNSHRFKKKKLYQIKDLEFFTDLESCLTIEKNEEFLNGGFPLKNTEESTVLVASSPTEIIFFTGIPYKMEEICIIDLMKLDDSIDGVIEDFEFYPISRNLIAYLDNGNVLFFSFKFESGHEYKVVYMEEHNCVDSNSAVIESMEDLNLEDGREEKLFENVKMTLESKNCLMFSGFHLDFLIKSVIVNCYCSALNSLCFSHSGKSYLFDCSQKMVKRLPVSHNTPISQLSLIESYLNGVLTKFIAICFQDGLVKIISVDLEKEISEIKKPLEDKFVYFNCLNENGESLEVDPSPWINDLLSPEEEIDSSMNEISSANSGEISPQVPESENGLKVVKKKKKRLSSLFSSKKSSSLEIESNHFMIFCTQHHLAVHSACSDKLISYVKCPSIEKAFVLNMNNGTCLACIGSDMSLYFYSIPSLDLIHMIPIGSFISSKNLADIYMTEDGIILSRDSFNSLVFIDLIASENRFLGFDCRHLDSSVHKVLLFNNLVDLPEKEPMKESWFSSMFSKTGNSNAKLSLELFFGSKEISKESMKPSEIHEETVKANSVFQQTHSALEERGERLQRLDMKTSDLAESSRNFAQMARKLREKQEKKKWYQL